MTVADLIYYLEEFDPEFEVRIAHQPNFPLEFGISKVVSCEDPDDDSKEIVYIAEGGRSEYLMGDACEKIGW